MDISITEIKLQRYLSADLNEGITLENIGHLNVLIGPNNVGKSVFGRFMKHICQNKVGDFNNNVQLPEQFWFRQQSEQPIECEFKCIVSDSFSAVNGMASVDPKFVVSGAIKFSLIVTRAATHFNPTIQIGEKTYQYVESRTLREMKLDSPVLNQQGTYSRAQNPNPFAAASNYLKGFLQQIRFFAPIRNVYNNSNSSSPYNTPVDGANLVNSLNALHHSANWKTRDKLTLVREALNEIISGDKKIPFLNFHFRQPSGTAGVTLELEDASGSYDLRQMGDGIGQILIICTELCLNDSESRIYFLEEPENHLHPALLARLIQFLKKSSTAQFFIITHSNVILDSLTKSDRVYLFSKNNLGQTSAKLCSAFTDMHNVLDSLGVKASSLLQANTVIWVEGPSDVNYIKGWINLVSTKYDLNLTEGGDYSFLIYGGSLGTHLSADGELSTQLVNVLRICRRSVIVMDSDVSLDSSISDMDKFKQRLANECGKDPDHRLAFFWTGREIEHEIDKEIFDEIISEKFNISKTILAQTSRDGAERIPNLIANKIHPGLTEEAKKERKLFATRFHAFKNELSTQAISAILQRIASRPTNEILPGKDYPQTIETITAFIRAGRTPDCKAS